MLFLFLFYYLFASLFIVCLSSSSSLSETAAEVWNGVGIISYNGPKYNKGRVHLRLCLLFSSVLLCSGSSFFFPCLLILERIPYIHSCEKGGRYCVDD